MSSMDQTAAACLWAGYSTIAVDYQSGSPTLVVLDPGRLRVLSVVTDKHPFTGHNTKVKNKQVQFPDLTSHERKTPAGHIDHDPGHSGNPTLPEGWRGTARTQ